MTEERSSVTPPKVEVLVDGHTDADLSRSLLGLLVTEQVGEHGTARLRVGHGGGSGKALPEDYPVRPGAEVTVRIGTRGDPAEVFTGLVTAVTLGGGPAGGVEATVVATSYSVLLDAGPRTRVAEDSSDADLLHLVAQERGLDSDVASGPTLERIADTALTDWQRVLARSARHGWVAYTRGRTLVARPPDAGRGVAKLSWGSNLREMALTEDLGPRHDPSVAVGWDPVHRETLTVQTQADETTPDLEGRPDLSQALTEAGLAGRDGWYAAVGPAHPEQLAELATSLAAAEALRHVTGSVVVGGDPRLRPDCRVTLDGIGRRLDGLHYVSGVRHRVQAGAYTTELTLGLPSVAPRYPGPRAGLTINDVPIAVAAEPAVGGVSGLTVGVVQGLDDPAGQVRLQVWLPNLGDHPTVWARLAVPDAGNGYGTFFVPSVGDEVVVGFIAGELTAPVVLGAMWGAAAPPPEESPDDNHVRSIVTPAGHTLRFDDGDGGTVELRSADGRRVLLDDEGHRIEVADPAGTSVVVDSHGVAITAEQGDVVIRAPAGEVRIEGLNLYAGASASATLEAGASLDLKSTATLTVKGSLVKIN